MRYIYAFTVKAGFAFVGGNDFYLIEFALDEPITQLSQATGLNKYVQFHQAVIDKKNETAKENPTEFKPVMGLEVIGFTLLRTEEVPNEN